MNTPLFFPPAPGETIYSMAARYRAAVPSTPRGNGYFFGRRSMCASSLLPTGLIGILHHFPIHMKPTVEEVVAKHTGFPLFAPFLSEQRLRKAMKAFEQGGSLHLILGTAPNGSIESHTPRLCPHCYEKDFEQLGYAYWHREHQLKCARVCYRHGTALQEGDQPVRDLLCSPNFQHPELENTKPLAPIADPQGLLPKIASDLAAVLNERHPRIDNAKILSVFRVQLVKRKLIQPNGSVSISKLSKLVRDHLPFDTLQTLGCPLRGSDSSNWVASIVRKRRTLVSPIKLALVSRVLGVPFSELLNDASQAEPFPAKGPSQDHPNRIKDPKKVAELRPEKRSLWLTLRTKGTSKEMLNAYAWLWRNDRDWLSHQKSTQRQFSWPRRDWESLDEELNKQLAEIHEHITNSGGTPTSVSKHALASKTKFAAQLLHNSDRLPRSRQTLDDFCNGSDWDH